jgi:hypothetical protein
MASSATDLHPANLLILPQNVVGYVDFGITGVLSRYSRRHLVEMTLAYTRADVATMAKPISVGDFTGATRIPTSFDACWPKHHKNGMKAGKPVRRRSRKTSRW